MSFRFLESELSVRGDISESHIRYWKRLSKPGAWFTSEQRIAIAQAVREAQCLILCY